VLPTPGFVSLGEAVEIVARKASGDIEFLIAKGCEAGRILASYREARGLLDLNRTVWQELHWRTYFDGGTIEFDLPLIDEKRQPLPDGRTARCTCEIFIRRDSLDRFIAELTPALLPTRYPGDAALIAEGRQMMASGMEKRAVARALAARAEGPATFESKVDRLRKAL
jgi:hypothetical protein